MSAVTQARSSDRAEGRLTAVLFCLLFCFHAWTMTLGWTSLALPGVEFRQAQTAISAHFIQTERNFSLAYPTPVLGKPWSIPMEFPLYQWATVWVSDATGLPLTQSGRAVSLACFYATLPALYLLLGCSGLAPSRRLLGLGFVLTCPLYVLYSRSFLMETMALMFSVWFLWAYLRMLDRPRAGWLLLASALGAGAALVKITTFLLLLAPAFVAAAAWLWRAHPARKGGGARELARRAGWALGGVAVPCLAAVWWVRYADAVKEMNPVGRFLTSSSLTGFNFGVGRRFSSELWDRHWEILFRELAPVWVIVVAAVLAVLFARRGWPWIAGLVGLFFLAQVIFPELYAWHAYYYVANGFALMLAFGFVAAGVLASALPRIAAWPLVLALFTGQILAFFHGHYREMKDTMEGGSQLTAALRLTTKPDDVLVIFGNDWNSMIPYYARRRALMIPTGHENDPGYLERAYRQLEGERVAALVMSGAQRENRPAIAQAEAAFGLDPRPLFTWRGSTVYVRRELWNAVIPVIKGLASREDLRLAPEAEQAADQDAGGAIAVDTLPAESRGLFAAMSPLPMRVRSHFGLGAVDYAGRKFFNAHPETELWFELPAGAHRLRLEGGLVEWAYEDKVPWGDRTDGVEFYVCEELPGGARRPLFSRLLNPRDNPADRKIVEMTVDFTLDRGAAVVIGTGPGPRNSLSRDWAVLGRIEFK
jgi:hypothetical protein